MKNMNAVLRVVGIVVGLVVLLGGGMLVFVAIQEPGVPKFFVQNESGQPLQVGPMDSENSPYRLRAGSGQGFATGMKGCETEVWVAWSWSGEVVAQSPGSCADYLWTIRGPNDSTYEWHCSLISLMRRMGLR